MGVEIVNAVVENEEHRTESELSVKILNYLKNKVRMNEDEQMLEVGMMLETGYVTGLASRQPLTMA